MISKTKPYTAPALGTGNRNVCAVSPAGVCVSSPKTRSFVAPVKDHAHVSPTSKVSYLEMYSVSEWYSSKHCFELFCLYHRVPEVIKTHLWQCNNHLWRFWRRKQVNQSERSNCTKQNSGHMNYTFSDHNTCIWTLRFVVEFLFSVSATCSIWDCRKKFLFTVASNRFS